MAVFQKLFSRRWFIFCLAALVVLCLGVCILRFNETPVGSITDDAYYVELARSIAEGKGPVIDLGPEDPVSNPDIFPPGFPLLLSPVAFLFPQSLTALKFIPLLATLCLIPLCLLLPGASAPPGVRLALASLVALNPWVVAWSGRILSDNIFSLLSLGAILVYLRWYNRAGHRHFWSLVFLVAFAMAVRTIGTALLLAMAVHLLCNRRFKSLLHLLGGAVAISLPFTLVSRTGNGWLFSKAYRDQMLGHSAGLSDRLDFLWSNLTGYLAEFPVAVLPLFGSPVRTMAGKMGIEGGYPLVLLVFGVFLVVGLLAGIYIGWKSKEIRDREQAGFIGLYLVFYVAALLNFAGYPTGVQTRLLIPLLPLIYFYLLKVCTSLKPPADSRTLVSVTILILFMSFFHNGWRIANPLHSSTEQNGRGFVDPGCGSAWVRSNTEADDVIMVQAPLERHIHFDRPVVAFGTLNGPSLRQRVSQYKVGYIFVGPQVHYLPRRLDENGESMVEILNSSPDKFIPVYEDSTENIFIFRAVNY